MNRTAFYNWLSSTRLRACRAAVACLCMSLLATACTIPGAIAPSTMPVTGKYVELGPFEESESCGYIFFIVPVGSPDHIADMIDTLVKSRGGDALIDVTSSSSTSWFLLGGSNCVQVRGKVVKFSK
jgi:hypothetical protein